MREVTAEWKPAGKDKYEAEIDGYIVTADVGGERKLFEVKSKNSVRHFSMSMVLGPLDDWKGRIEAMVRASPDKP